MSTVIGNFASYLTHSNSATNSNSKLHYWQHTKINLSFIPTLLTWLIPWGYYLFGWIFVLEAVGMIGSWKFRATLVSVNVNWGICLTADGQAMCGGGFHCLCAYGLSVCFIRLLLVLKSCFLTICCRIISQECVIGLKAVHPSFPFFTFMWLHCSTSTKVPSMTRTWHCRTSDAQKCLWREDTICDSYIFPSDFQ